MGGGRPRRITDGDWELIVKVARKRPRSLGQPFSRWSLRKLQGYLATKKGRKVVVSRERLRQILAEEGITFQRTKTWKESPDPLKEEKLRRIEEVCEHHPDRTFAFVEFGPPLPPALRGIRLGGAGKTPAGEGQLPSVVGHSGLLRLLFGLRGPDLREGLSPQVPSQLSPGSGLDPGAATRRGVDLCHLRQPVGPQGLQGHRMVREQPDRALLDDAVRRPSAARPSRR